MISQEAVDLFIDVLAEVHQGNNADQDSVIEVAYALGARLERDYVGYSRTEIANRVYHAIDEKR